MKKLILVGVLLSFVSISAQAPKTSTPIPEVKKELPKVPEEIQVALRELQNRNASLTYAQQILQKERDSVIAEFTRTMQKLQLPDYDLTIDRNGDVAYVEKKK